MELRMTDSRTRATAERYGYVWNTERREAVTTAAPHHYHLMRTVLGAPALRGRILDAGCGDGFDLASIALDPACRAVGIELSFEGSLVSQAHAPSATVIRGDVRRLPFRDQVFDGAYSYGVVHHTTDPEGAVREIASTLRPGAPLLLYVYEDFSDRSFFWRLGLRLTAAARLVTSRLPPATLWHVCRALAPAIYALCAAPARRLSKPWPYHECASAGEIVPNLYDRLSPPIECRYSKDGAVQLLTQAGLEVLAVGQQRGWMVYGFKGPLNNLDDADFGAGTGLLEAK
jgi:SAM-dependent methyltransferase